MQLFKMGNEHFLFIISTLCIQQHVYRMIELLIILMMMSLIDDYNYYHDILM